MFIRSITFALMSKQSAFDYKILASYLLPKGILKFFDVTAVNEDHTGIIEETGNERVLLHIYLDEKDAREEEWHDLKPNGFTESRQVNDFPIRNHKVVLHVRRRRWLTAGTGKGYSKKESQQEAAATAHFCAVAEASFSRII